MGNKNQQYNRNLWEMIVEWFESHTAFSLSIEHHKNFWFIWEVLLVLAFGLILLVPVLEWYYRVPLIIITGLVLWSHLMNLCKLIGIGTIIFSIVYIGLVVFFMFLSPISGWQYSKWLFRIMLFLLMLLIILRPMNAVYGLMGTSGSIRIFFFNFVIISLIFSSIYYFGFFKDAGISYDVNQPHIDYQKYAVTAKADTTKTDSLKIIVSTKRDTVYVEHQLDTISYTETIIQTYVTRDTIMPTTPLQYQPIGFLQVWRSTILTTLTQESADLLAIATVHNEAMESTNVGLDKEKSELFEWILIFHIIISWIFFGVFISLLYNKFRYES